MAAVFQHNISLDYIVMPLNGITYNSIGELYSALDALISANRSNLPRGTTAQSLFVLMQRRNWIRVNRAESKHRYTVTNVGPPHSNTRLDTVNIVDVINPSKNC
jgi:hypothetical protein